MKHTRTALTALLASSFAFGCGGSTSEPKSQGSEPAMSEPEPAPAALAPTPTAQPTADDSMAANVTAAPAAANEPAPTPLADAQIAAITDTANTGEVEQATVAQKKAKNARVKKFAGMMIAHHTKAKQDQAKLLKKLNMTPEENPKSTALAEESKTAVESLKNTEPSDFDRVYIDGQVSAHQKVLDMLVNELIPNAKHADLKAALEEFRPKVEAHLTEAQEIQSLLQTGSAATSSNK
jgi:putative membrane protein